MDRIKKNRILSQQNFQRGFSLIKFFLLGKDDQPFTFHASFALRIVIIIIISPST